MDSVEVLGREPVLLILKAQGTALIVPPDVDIAVLIDHRRVVGPCYYCSYLQIKSLNK
jgi:hypothetical protein